MTKFADQLYDDLMRQHGPALAATRPPAASRRHTASRRALLVTGAGGLAVAATAGALTVGGGTPAYALTTNRDGTITLAVYQASGIAQANTKLRELGDNVVVVPARPGCPGIGSLPTPVVRSHGSIIVESTRSADGSITVNARGVPAGDIIVVAAETTAAGTQMASELTSPPAPNCVSLPSPSRVSGVGTAGESSGGPASSHTAHGSESGLDLFRNG